MAKNIFPKWTNYLPIFMLLSISMIGIIVIFIIWYWFSPKHLNIGYQPKQPIPFSHKKHAGELGIDCRYCHNTVEDGAHAAIPSTETCLNCHNNIKKDSPHIKKLHKSFETNTPIKWVKVHQLPDYTYFNHSRHVNSGVSCFTCHGQVNEMKEVYQAQSLSMGWCLECHRNPEKFIRPKSELYNPKWTSKNQKKLGKDLVKAYDIHPREACSTCHR